MGSATTDNEWLKKDTGKEQKMTKKWPKNDKEKTGKITIDIVTKMTEKMTEKWLIFLVNNREIFPLMAGMGWATSDNWTKPVSSPPSTANNATSATLCWKIAHPQLLTVHVHNEFQLSISVSDMDLWLHISRPALLVHFCVFFLLLIYVKNSIRQSAVKRMINVINQRLWRGSIKFFSFCRVNCNVNASRGPAEISH